jgi:hypothetical protein
MHHDLGVRACWVFIIVVSAACKDLKSLFISFKCFMLFSVSHVQGEKELTLSTIARSSPGAKDRMSQTTR